MKRLIIVLTLLLFCVASLHAQDPGEPDSLIYQSNVYVPYNPGEWSTATVEVYFVTDDSIVDFSIPTTWYSSDGQIFPDSVVRREALEGWDDVWYNILLEDELIRILGWCDLSGPDNEPLYTDMQRVVGFEIWFSISPSASRQIVAVDSTQDTIIPILYFGLFGGVISFTPVVVPGSIYYGIEVAIDGQQTELPSNYSLAQNFPNPFNPETKIDFELPDAEIVTIEIFNVLGQNVRTLISEYKEAGKHSVTWNGTDNHSHPVPTGIYFYRMTAGDYIESKKMVFIK